MNGQDSVSGVQVTACALLSKQMYELACAFTADMLQGKPLESKTFSVATALPLAAVILAHASLEAYLNEFLNLREHMDPQKWAAAISELRRASIQSKWALAAQLFGGKSFDKAGEPYQSFSLLVTLRNELIHYDPGFRPLGTFPSKTIEALNIKFPFEYPGKTDWTVQVLNPKCAKWVCGTVRAMISKFHELVGDPDLTALPPIGLRHRRRATLPPKRGEGHKP